MSRQVLVTGAGGIIGRAVVRRLSAEGHQTISVLRPSGLTSCENTIVADLADASVKLDINPAIIVHLAAAVPSSPDRGGAEECAETTRKIDGVVHALAQSTGSKVIYASGCSLYDAEDNRAKKETADLNAVHPYLKAKLDGEAMFSDLPGCCIARISSPYGEGMFGTSVLGRFIEAARSKQTIEVWGTGKREQDFIHASDIADFVLRAINREAAGIFNVASGKPVGMLSLARTVCDIVGSGSVVLSEQEDPQEHCTARYDLSQAEAVLSWKPRVDLACGIAVCRDTIFRS